MDDIPVCEHPLLDCAVFVSRFNRGIAVDSTPESLLHLLALGVEAPLKPTDEVRDAVRRMLRFGGFKPSGRSKPAAEYLLRTAQTDGLTSINLPVDICNIVSLHSGLPISVVDLDVSLGPHRIAIAEEGSNYLFNRSGQSIDIGGLVCLFDAVGPCANAVKDSQRTKTSDETATTLTVIWGTREDATRTSLAQQWYQRLLEPFAKTEDVTIV